MPMHRNRSSRQNRRLGRKVLAVTASLAVPAFVLPQATAAAADAPHPVAIFVDGTKPILPGSSGEGAADIAKGAYFNLPGFERQWTPYPQSFGILTGLNDPGYDQSVAQGTDANVAGIKQARLDNPGQPIVVVGLSQGADVNVQTKKRLAAEGFDLSNVYFVEAGSPRNNDGGILARLSFLPVGVYVPLLGITLGGPDSGNPPIPGTNDVQLVRQYDGVADAPKYILNVVADANAIMGFYYLHGHYSDIDLNDPNAVISSTPDGSVTNVLFPTKQLPLTMPLRQLGVPNNVVDALDLFLRPIIETGYDRPSGLGDYPTTAQPFELAPPPGKWAQDAQSIVQGAQQSLQAFANLANPAPALPSPSKVDVVQPKVDPQLDSSPPVNGSQYGGTTVKPVQQYVAPAPPVQQDSVSPPPVVKDGVQQQEKPFTNVVRNSLAATPGTVTNGVTSNGSSVGNPVSQVVGGLTETVKGTVNNVTDTVSTALGTKPGASSPSGATSASGSSTGTGAGSTS